MGAHLFAYLAFAFGRNPCPHFTIPNLGPRQDDCTGRDYSMFAHHCMVHHRRPHSNERALLDARPVYDGVVSEAHVVLKPRFTLTKRSMHDHSVLDVDTFPDVDGCNISPQHCLEPYRAVSPKGNLADHGGVWRKPGGVMKNWGVPVDWEDGGHGCKLPSLACHPSDVHRRPHIF